MDASLMSRLKELEDENRRLKKMYAEERLKAEIAVLDDALKGYESDIAKLQKKLSEARARQSNVSTRLESAENKYRLREMTNGDRVEAAFSRFHILERRVDEAEGRADALNLGYKKSLDEEIAELQAADKVADEGYDVKSIYNTVKTVYEGEAFIPLNPRGTKASKTLSAGNPVCEAGLAMHKDGKTTDNGRTRQKYCCPFRQSKTGVCPCNHKNWNNGKKNRGCTKYKTIPNDYRLSIDRSCLYFKRTYALRTECERYNSRFKSTGQERLWVRNGNSVANLNTLVHISALTVALAAVLHGSHSYRSAKQLRRSA